MDLTNIITGLADQPQLATESLITKAEQRARDLISTFSARVKHLRQTLEEVSVSNPMRSCALCLLR